MKKNKIIGIVLAIISIITIAVGGVYYMYVDSNKPISSTSDYIMFEVVPGDTATSVAKRLEEEQVIKNAFFTELMVRFNHLSDIKIGLYELDRAWDTQQIFEVLINPTAAITNEVSITLREGIWAKDIAALIQEQTNVTSDELLTLWNDETFLNTVIERYDFITTDILNDQARVKLEGYFFPETYYFFKETTAQEVTYAMLDQSQKVYDSIKLEVEASNLSYYEILTLASIVQFESATVDQMRMIAGIFFNRLQASMKLQSSVTVCYALYDYLDWTECEKDVTIDSPYNTYLYEGLPPGPILNPGLDAIKAVLDPEASNYYYFIADVCSDGKVYYAETFAEHQANVDKYLTCY